MARGPKQATGADLEKQLALKAAGEVPRHVAVIMDGNGRWAKERGMPRAAGHSEGVDSVRDIVEVCGQLGVAFLTIYAFSTENWKRPKDEVSLIMRLIVKALRDEADRLHDNNVRISAIGDFSKLPEEVAREVHDAIRKTSENSGLTLVLALSYSGRWDLLQAVRSAVRDRQTRGDDPATVTEGEIAAHLSTAGIPDPDLLIRTSGEYRLSNFLLWQLAYAEMYITRKYWPSFRRDDFYEAVADYQKRERRFGLVSEQLSGASGGASGQIVRALRSLTGK